jgi:citronellyl-CoA dehydrogenase
MGLFREEHGTFRHAVREVVSERLTPLADDLESSGSIPGPVFRDIGDRGLLGLTQPPEYGGRGLDFGYAAVLAEELPRCRMGGVALSILAQTNFFLPLLAKHGTTAQKTEFLAPAIRGDKIGAPASTEPMGGSDISGAVQCRAEDDGDFWVVSGEKMKSSTVQSTISW